MITVLSVLVWVAEAVEWLLSLGWWLVPVFVPGAIVGAWLWLRPTGKRRRPRPRRAAGPVPAPQPAVDQDTIVFQAATHAGVPTSSSDGEADR
ncbi:hypothetical protein ACFQ6O_34620 [Streptomyces sp. NPDC056441]|uniref:hypothetical protein n=1 Tax=Streptomyces sp. NPDC056441 TaxID=3345817 RepID=UPI003682AEBD